jgi:hypothetical protein
MEPEKKPWVKFMPIQTEMILEKIPQHDPKKERAERIKTADEEINYAKKYLAHISETLFTPTIYQEDFLYDLLFIAENELTNAEIRKQQLISAGEGLLNIQNALLEKEQGKKQELNTIQYQLKLVKKNIIEEAKLIKKMNTIITSITKYTQSKEQNPLELKIDKSQFSRKKQKPDQE